MSTARHRRQQFMQGNDSMIINTSRTAVNISSELDQIQEAAYELAETPLHKTEDQELLEPSRRITIEVEEPTPNEKKPINSGYFMSTYYIICRVILGLLCCCGLIIVFFSLNK